MPSYVHLGSTVSHCGSSAADVRHKTRLTAPCFRRLHSTLLRNPELTRSENVALTSSLILAKVGFGSLWCPSSVRDTAACHNAISCGGLSEEEVCQALGMPSPEQYLLGARVRQLSVVALQGPGFLWSTLLAASDWLLLAFEAAAKVSDVLDLDFWRSAPMDGEAQLVHCQCHSATLAALPGRYSRAIAKNSCSTPVFAKAKLHTALEKEGWVSVTLPSLLDKEHRCPDCKAACRSKSALAVHHDRRHGRRLITTAATGRACHACGVELWSTYRLREHLRREPRCKAVWNEADLDAPQPFESTGSRSDKAWRAPEAVQGPKRFWATLAPPTQDFVAERESLPDGLSRFRWVKASDAAFDDTCIGLWLQQVYRQLQEDPEVADLLPEGPTQEAVDILSKIFAQEPGTTLGSGRVQCLLGERHRLWAKRA